MSDKPRHFAICVRNDENEESLDLRKIYEILEDSTAAQRNHVRVIDESGEDYLYPADYFVSVELPQKAKRAWTANRGLAKRRRSSNEPLQRTGARVTRSGR